jgi:hypothetical protein
VSLFAAGVKASMKPVHFFLRIFETVMWEYFNTLLPRFSETPQMTWNRLWKVANHIDALDFRIFHINSLFFFSRLQKTQPQDFK